MTGFPLSLLLPAQGGRSPETQAHISIWATAELTAVPFSTFSLRSGCSLSGELSSACSLPSYLSRKFHTSTLQRHELCMRVLSHFSRV